MGRVRSLDVGLKMSCTKPAEYCARRTCCCFGQRVSTTEWKGQDCLDRSPATETWATASPMEAYAQQSPSQFHSMHLAALLSVLRSYQHTERCCLATRLGKMLFLDAADLSGFDADHKDYSVPDTSLTSISRGNESRWAHRSPSLAAACPNANFICLRRPQSRTFGPRPP